MKNHLIIGGSSGIGLSLCRLLSKQGDIVFATYNQTNPPQDAMVNWIKLDVLNEPFDLGSLPDAIDGLAYCPGNINLKPFGRFKPQDFMADYELQVIGAVKILQAVLPKIKNSPQASIVFFSTVAVQNGFNFHSLVAASKGAVEGLARSLAAEFAPKIRVNCIAPSITDTPLADSLLSSPEKKETNAQRHPLKKIGQPEDVAELAAFLLSEKSNWMTGQVLHLDGGISSLRV